MIPAEVLYTQLAISISWVKWLVMFPSKDIRKVMANVLFLTNCL